MGIIVRQSILTSVISYVGVVIGYVNILYLYPKFLEPDQIGLLRTVQDAAMLFAPFAMFGLGQSIIKFFPYFSADRNQSNSFVTFILTLGLLTYGLFILAFLAFQDFFISFFSEKAGNIIAYTPLILWLTFILLFMALLEQYSRSLLNVALPSFLREIVIRILQGLLVTLYFVGYISFKAFIFHSVLIYVVAVVILGGYMVYKRELRFSFRFAVIPRPILKQIFAFSSLSFVGTSAMILMGKMDSLMVSGMIGLELNAIYTTAFYIATVIEIPKRAITTTASTLIAKAFEKNNLNEVATLYAKASINQLIIGGLLLIGIWANLSSMFDLMPKGDYYRAGSYVILIVGAGKLIDMAFGPSSEIIGLSKHYWFNLIVISILAGVVIVSNYILIPRIGIEGAAYGTVLALFIYNAAKFVFIYKVLKIQPFSVSTLKVIGICAVVAAINLVLPRAENVFVDIVYRSGVITIVYAALVIMTRCSVEVNQLFRHVIGLVFPSSIRR